MKKLFKKVNWSNAALAFVAVVAFIAILAIAGCAWHGNANMVLEPHLKPSLCDVVD